MNKLVKNYYLTLIFFIITSFFLISCTSNRQVREVAASYYEDENYEKVEEILQKENKDGDQIDLLIDEAMVKVMKDDYKGAITVFNKAYMQMQQFTGDMSNGDKFLAGLLNEESVKYYGPAYEYSLLDSISAYNFIKLGDLDSARAMMRRSLNNNKDAFNKLKALQKEFETRSAESINSSETISALQAFESAGESIPINELMSPEELKNNQGDYELSPFIFYLGSLLFANNRDFEIANNWLFNIAPDLNKNLIDSVLNIPEGMGSINVISLADNIVRRKEAVRNITIFQDWVGIRLNFKLTWPYVPVSNNIVKDVYIHVLEPGTNRIVGKDKSIVIEDFDEAVRRDVSAKAMGAYNRSLIRNITRKSTTYVVGVTALGITINEVSENDTPGGMLLVMNGILTLQAALEALDAGERADVRQGAFFPSKARAASVIVEPGIYDIVIDYVDNRGKIVNREIVHSVQVNSGIPTIVGSDFINTGNFMTDIYNNK